MTTETFRHVQSMASRRGFILKQVRGCYALYPKVHGKEEVETIPFFSKSLHGLKLYLEKTRAGETVRPRAVRKP